MPRHKSETRVSKGEGRNRAPRPALNLALQRVRLLFCDVDGVLTNGRVLIGDGREFKEFNIQDGLAMHLLQRNGIKVGWVSNRPSPATQQRAAELKIDYLIQEKGSKAATMEPILAAVSVKWEEVCYVGDDLVDLGSLKRAGVAVAVANGVSEVKAIADYVTTVEGGHGAVREVTRLILTAQRKWHSMVQEYSA